MLTREEQLTVMVITEALELAALVLQLLLQKLPVLAALLVENFCLKLENQWLLLVVQTRKDIQTIRRFFSI